MAGYFIRPMIGQRHTLGHEIIDADHKAIGEWWQRAVNCEPIQSKFFIARLKSLMRKHFAHEAQLMEQSGGTLCECHWMEHQQWIELCDQADALSSDNWKKARSLLRIELPRLVRDHIITMDQLTVIFINTHGTHGVSAPHNC